MTRSSEKEGSVRAPLSLSDLVSAFTAKALDEGRTELERAVGKDGHLYVEVDVKLRRGQPEWHTASVRFARYFGHSE